MSCCFRFVDTSTLAEIETAITKLPQNDVQQLALWLQNYVNDLWGHQLEADLKSGKLGSLISKAETDIAAHHFKSLDEVIHNT